MAELNAKPFSNLESPPALLEASADYLHDESKVSAPSAKGLYRPETISLLRSAIARAVDDRSPITVSGARTGVTGGAVPEPDHTIISTDRLKRIFDFDRDSRTIWLEAGVTIWELNTYLDSHAPELFLPVDPTEMSASFGGLVSTNAGGARSFRFGSIRNWIVGLQVELTSQSTLLLLRNQLQGDRTLELTDSAGKRTISITPISKPPTKCSAGYGFFDNCNPIDLFIGAEGTLGVISAVQLKLGEKPKNRVFLIQFVASKEQAFLIVNTVRKSRSDNLFAIEYLDNRALELARNHSPTTRLAKGSEGCDGALIFEFGCATEVEATEAVDRIFEIVGDAGADLEKSLAGFEEQVLREIKAFRHAVPESVNRTIAERKRQYPGLHKLATDIVAQDHDLGWVFDLYRTTLDEAKLDHTIFGHIGDNHFHVNIIPKNQEELERAKRLYVKFAEQIVPRGGAVSGEHGLGRLKRDFLQIQYPPEVMAEFRAIRKFFDPSGLLNPGVLFVAR